MTPGQFIDAVIQEVEEAGGDPAKLAFSYVPKTGHVTMREADTTWEEFHVPPSRPCGFASLDVHPDNVEPLIRQFAEDR